MADDKIKVVIAFDPNNREREGKTEEMSPAEAHSMVHTGRARYFDAEAEKADAGESTNRAPAEIAGEPTDTSQFLPGA
jgi:hypothetical protein